MNGDVRRIGSLPIPCSAMSVYDPCASSIFKITGLCWLLPMTYILQSCYT
jgi:hypothetical protein